MSSLNFYACKYSPQNSVTVLTLSEILACTSKAVEVEPCESSEGPITRQTTGNLPIPEPLRNISMAEELNSKQIY